MKQYYCKDCNHKIHQTTFKYGKGRCKECANIQSSSLRMRVRRSYKGKNNPFYGKKHSFKTRQKMKKNHPDIFGENNPFYGREHTKETRKRMKQQHHRKLPSHGKHIKYKNIWMRSSWEVKYAQYLDNKKINWEYESKTFNLGLTNYTPDFYLPKTNEYIEIKGYWRDDAKNKFRLFRKRHNSIKITVLNRKKLTKLEIL